MCKTFVFTKFLVCFATMRTLPPISSNSLCFFRSSAQQIANKARQKLGKLEIYTASCYDIKSQKLLSILI